LNKTKNIKNLYPIFSKIPESITGEYVRDTLIEQKKDYLEKRKTRRKNNKVYKIDFLRKYFGSPLDFSNL